MTPMDKTRDINYSFEHIQDLTKDTELLKG